MISERGDSHENDDQIPVAERTGREIGLRFLHP